MKLNYFYRTLILTLSAWTCASAQAATWYVNANATGDGSGDSWINACKTVQTCVDKAYDAGGGDVWVAKGTYRASAANAYVLTLKSNVAIYGGFSGGEDEREDRDWRLM